MDADTSSAGLIVLRASRLEALVPLLQLCLEATTPDSLLAPQTVIAAHPGMKPWLSRELARHVGSGRVVANLDVTLPSSWFDGLATELLGQQAVALPRYRRQHLRWTLHEMLSGAGVEGMDDPRVLRYLQPDARADELALRRFQLADRLARIYSQYLVYRRDWLAAWEADNWTFASQGVDQSALQELESRFLAPLWKALSQRLGDHRAGLMHRLAGALKSSTQALPPLHVFGLSHLPSAELDILLQYARCAAVFLYVPDPCREYWGGLHLPSGSGRWRQPDAVVWDDYRDAERKRLDATDEIDWHEQPHPLLARWGRMGQHFFASLVEGEVREDTRHWQDELDTPPAHRLARLQEGFRQLDAGLMQEDVHAPVAREDASLRIHACHTRLRELEVLRDVLLDAVDRLAVQPGSIVVMAPDIQAYLPLIPTVFGQPGSVLEQHLPYHLADVPVSRSHRLFQAFATLLELGSSRLTATEIVDLISVPEICRALGIDSDELGNLVEWLRLSNAAWGLGPEHKRRLDLPARAENTFAWAVDRMLTGYLMADNAELADAELVELADGTTVLPVSGIGGPTAAALGGLDYLLRELHAWQVLAQSERSASEWSDALAKRVETLFKSAPDDEDATTALSLIKRAISNLKSEPEANEENPVLRLSVVRELIDEVLSAAPERQRFLMGGITFCGMVPQRAIPFDVVCVLGLNEGEFPRQPSDGGIDLMSRLRRLGDRDVPTDDRYLFLETLMSARQQLHLSYVGQGVQDGTPRNPAAPLAELIAELDRQCQVSIDAPDSQRPWLIRHRLQPFDASYYTTPGQADPALFSYSQRFADMSGDRRSPLPGFRGDEFLDSAPLPAELTLQSLIGYFKDPARAILRDHLSLTLDALDTDSQLPESEPLDGISPIHTVARTVFLHDALPMQFGESELGWAKDTPPAWIAHAGILPIGERGQIAWQEQANAVQALLDAAVTSGRFDAFAAKHRQTLAIDVTLPPMYGAAAPLRITGTVRNVFPLEGDTEGIQLLLAFPTLKDKFLKKSEEIHFGDLLPAFLQWALLRLHRRTAEGEPASPVRVTMLAADEPLLAASVNRWDEAYCDAAPAEQQKMEVDISQRIFALAALRQAGLSGRGHYYPRTGWRVARHLQKQRDNAGESDAGDDASGFPSGLAKAIGSTWASHDGRYSGERDYAPGYAALLEGDMVFGDAESDPQSAALHSLLRQVETLERVLDLDQPLPGEPT